MNSYINIAKFNTNKCVDLRNCFDFVFRICYSLFFVVNKAYFELHTHRYGVKNR
jgi:hypothetical protein